MLPQDQIANATLRAIQTKVTARRRQFPWIDAVGQPTNLGRGSTQVLLKLVGNAIKFTDAGEVTITAGARNGHFAVSVANTA